jgi:hypothetical protein
MLPARESTNRIRVRRWISIETSEGRNEDSRVKNEE